MRLFALAFAAAGLLAGCAHPWNAGSLPPGTPREEVLAKAGPPARVVPLAGGGQRLQYPQPGARQAFMIDLDAAGRLVRARQVLTELDFHRIEVDRWNRADIEREFGPPHRVDGVTSWNGPIYTYRWYGPGHGDMFYWVYFDPQGVVRRAHPGMEHRDAPDDRRL